MGSLDTLFLLDLLIAAVCGAALGLERELQRKPSGLRTNMLIAIGAALFTYASVAISSTGGKGDPARIAAQIVTGVGFLGAGAIMRHGSDSITGLTSAATVWVVAAIGILAGAHFYMHAISATVLALIILEFLARIETWLRIRLSKYTLHLAAHDREGILTELDRIFRQDGVVACSIKKTHAPNGDYAIEFEYDTTPERHQRLVRHVTALPGMLQAHGRMR